MRILPILLSENCVQIGAILMEKQGFDGQMLTLCNTDVDKM